MIDYLAKARRCRTENQFNRLHIELDATLAPSEIAAIREVSKGQDFPEAGRAWLGVLEAHSPALSSAPEPFSRIELHPNVLLYRGASPERRTRLLLAFTGVARRLMIPTSAFLQSLDAGLWDVCLVRHRGSFLDGAEGVAEDLDGLLAFLKRRIGFRRYRAVSVFGVSSGGGPAAVAALRIGARRGMSMCGASGERLLQASVRPYFWPALRRRRPELRFVHGAGNVIDRDAAAAMAGAWGGTMLAVDGVKSHNVMGSLMKRGLLKDFLAETL